jgi:teichuronic acid biosynthesis glycosyltransferase TuaG
MRKGISVIIPTWNRAQHLAAAISSVLEQTIPPDEVLVCDDGSTDGSEEVVRGIGDGRVKWVPGPRGGRPAIPRNRGLAVSNGEWVAFLDSDDRWVPERLEKQLVCAESNGCLAVSSNALRVDPEGRPSGHVVSWTRARITFRDLLKTNQVICSSAIIRRSLLDKAVGFPEQRELTACEDYALWLRVSTQTDFAFVAEPLVIYRDDPAVSIRNANPDALTVKKKVLNDFLNWANATDQRDMYKRATRRALATAPMWAALGEMKQRLVQMVRLFW